MTVSNCFTMIFLNFNPFLFLIDWAVAFVNKVTSKTINARFFIQEWVAIFCFVWNICFGIASKFMCSMSELTLISIRAKSCLCKIPTERALYIGFIWGSCYLWIFKVFRFRKTDNLILSLCRYVREGFWHIRAMLISLYLSRHFFLYSKRLINYNLDEL